MTSRAATIFPDCPVRLSTEQSASYAADGYLAFQKVLTPEEVAEARQALSALVQRTTKRDAWRTEGPFWYDRKSGMMIQFEPGYAPDTVTDAAAMELKVRKLMGYQEQHPHLHHLAFAHPRLQGVLESLLGPSPILFQDMALIKPPWIGSEKPWHQDNAYFSVAPLDAVAGVWIALDAATTHNGCMHVIPGAHRRGALSHLHDDECAIISPRFDPGRSVPIELEPGGALFFHGMLPHQTPPNASPDRRRALQFHYRSADSRIVAPQEYDRLFAEPDGTPASCAASRARQGNAPG